MEINVKNDIPPQVSARQAALVACLVIEKYELLLSLSMSYNVHSEAMCWWGEFGWEGTSRSISPNLLAQAVSGLLLRA